MKKTDLKAIKTRPHLIAKFPHLFQPGGGFPHLDQILDLTLHIELRSHYHSPGHRSPWLIGQKAMDIRYSWKMTC